MYEVIGGVKSRTLRVLWMLEEIGATYQHLAAAPRSDEVVTHNPSGKVPVFLVDGEALTDSMAILSFLGDRHGKLTHPSGSIERARQDGLSFRILDEIDATLWTAARHSFVLPEEMRVPQVKATLKWEFEQATQYMSNLLGDKPFLMGDEMTIPDILLTHCLGWAINARFPFEDKNLRAFLDRLRSRDAFQRAVNR
jgi:glutathione S-transferase